MSSEHDPSEHDPSEHTHSEHEPSEHSYSADLSGYVTSRPRGRRPAEVERDPYDGDLEVNSASLIRPHSTTFRGPRVITTARKSVPLPRCVRFTNPSRDIGESSRQGAQSGATQVVTGVPVTNPPGMTALESQWVSMMSQDIQLHQARLDQHHQTLNTVRGILNAQSEVSDRTMTVITFTRREMRTLRMYLTWMIGALVAMLGLLIWGLMR